MPILPLGNRADIWMQSHVVCFLFPTCRAVTNAYSISRRCRCKNQFCFECLAKWKSCLCDMWNEDRLLERAAMLVDRDGPQAPVPGQARDDHIRDVARDVRANYACIHSHPWTEIRGFHRCENCRYNLYLFIFECPDCRLRVCRWCRDGYVIILTRRVKCLLIQLRSDDRPRHRLRRND